MGHRKALYRELYDLTKHGRVGSYEVARRMPTELRRFWFEQMAADNRSQEEEARAIRR